ncbi:MAG: DUF2971 domain-containing protein [Melioribacteraceae bacterium]
MKYTNYKNKKKWQKKFIDDVLNQNVNTNFTKSLLNDTNKLKEKSNYIPKSLCKYYCPTSENILDIQKKCLWLSNPYYFNDPFDCKTGYDSIAYEKNIILEFIKENGLIDKTKIKDGFTEVEKNRILNSKIVDYDYLWTNYENYDSVIYKILNEKNYDFRVKIHSLIRKLKLDIENKMNLLRKSEIRVACFSEFNRLENFKKNLQMWSHYADNHKGFCIEYDLTPLKEFTSFTKSESDYYLNKNEYIDEKLKAAIIAGLFPIIYTSNRVNVPVTKLKKLKIDGNGKLINNIDLNKILLKTFIIKSTNWSYEKEWRIIIDEEIADHFDNKIPFPYIHRIYLGCKMDRHTADMIFEIGKELNFETIQLKMDGKRFLLEEESSYLREWEKEEKKRSNPFKQF